MPPAGEIVVTAQKRRQSIQDVPYNIAAVSTSALSNAGVLSANDLTRVVSGLGSVDEGVVSRVNQNNFSLRGLRTEAPNSTFVPSENVSAVSTYYGDTPVFFSILMKDLERVEVLRGPQGTLYGSGAEGGAIRFIPNRPSFTKFEGQLNESVGMTDGAVGVNNAIDGVLNLPLSDKLALRVTAADLRMGGFIKGVDRFVLGPGGVPTPSIPGDLLSGPIIAPVDKGSNSSDEWMTRVALRYAPAAWLDIEFDYLHQDARVADVQISDPLYRGGRLDLSGGLYPNGSLATRGGGDYETTAPYRQPYRNTLNLGSLAGVVEFSFATLTTVTSYYQASAYAVGDGTGFYLPGTFNFLAPYAYFPRFTARANSQNLQEGLVQEVRLVSKSPGPFSYVFGIYYEDKSLNSDLHQYAPGVYQFASAVGVSGSNPELSDEIFVQNHHDQSSDKAIFGEITYHITKNWQITGGFRAFEDNFTADFLHEFPFSGPAFGDGVSQPIALGATRAHATQSISSHIVKVNTSYDFKAGDKIYATYSEGFRRGGANGLPLNGPFASLPRYLTYQPDYAKNYEIGLKGLILDRRVRYAVDGFLIDLQNFQFNGVTPSILGATFNGNSARSVGAEAEVAIRAGDHLNVSLGYTYTDASVSKGVKLYDLKPYALFTPGSTLALSSSNRSGSELPGVSRHTATAAIDYAIPLTGGGQVLLHADANYHSRQRGLLDSGSIDFWLIPSVFIADLRATYDPGKRWAFSIFVDNVTNAVCFSGGGGNSAQPNIFTTRVVGRPRTAGVAVRHAF